MRRPSAANITKARAASAFLGAVLLACSCSGPDDVDGGIVFPSVDGLPEQVEPPDPFVSFVDRRAIRNVTEWEQIRRPELLRLFDHYLYGVAADAPAVAVVETSAATIAGGATLRELEVEFGDAPRLHVALFLPAGVERPPVVLGLNKCGNQSVSIDEAVTPTTAWVNSDCESGTGGRASYWSIGLALSAGFAVATVHQSEVDPDDARDTDRNDGVHPHFATGEPPWATLSAWAWGLSRVVDALEQHGVVDSERIVVFGHSRRGKAALLAGARDRRIAMVWAHQSGTGGAALSRSLQGESIASITLFFPHWFVPTFGGFAGRETLLPVDQHLLLALQAPRPLLVTDGDEDDWADPSGASRAVDLARPVWALYGVDRLAWSLRDGGHEVREEDWSRMLEHATKWL